MGMYRSVWGAGRRALGSVWEAIRARPLVFAGVAVTVFALNLILPLAVLTVARKPWDYFSFNPWLSQLPQWLVSPAVSWSRKLEFLQNLSLFWFMASSPYDEPEWGFAVGLRDLVRWAFVASLFGAYFALWVYARSRRPGRGWGSGRPGGVAGALVSTLGLSTAPCSVMGCGAPVLPVVGLALQGLSSSALVALATLSSVANVVVEIGMSLVVLGLGWIVGRDEAGRRAAAGARVAGIGAGAAPPGR